MSPTLFTIGPFNVYAFGFFLSLAFLFSTFIIFKFASQELHEEEYLDAYLYTSIVALISARLSYIIFHFPEFGLNILRYIVVRETPGLSLIGGLAGGVIYLYFFAHRKKYDFWHIADLVSIAGSFGLFISKIGEQLGGASFGRETSFFLGVKIAGISGRHHPVEMYEAILILLLTVFLYLIYQRVNRQKWPVGLVACLFLFLLCLIIFLLEFLKEHQLYLYGLSLKQTAVLIILFILSPFLIYRIKILKGILYEISTRRS